jgi:hypothetical protein
MRHLFKSISDSYAFFEFVRKTFVDLHDLGALDTNQMMPMAIVPFIQQTEPGPALAKIKTLHHALRFQHVHRTINRGQIANPLTQSRKNLPNTQWGGLAAQDRKNGLTRSGQFPSPTLQAVGQCGHFWAVAAVNGRFTPHVWDD